MLKRFQFILWLLLAIPAGIFAQNCGFGAPIAFPINDSLEYKFEIFDVINDNLANPIQGVCRVEMRFLHPKVSDLEMWLISPAGQQVNLIGPNSTIDYGGLGAQWDIAFVDCATIPQPEPGFLPRWDNNLNQFAGASYSGTYHPFQGCLEDLNTGSVNGTWTLKVRVSPTNSFITGALNSLRDFKLVLCDTLGQNCCFSDAGSWTGNRNLTSCAGSSNLQLTNTIAYAGTPPADSLYGYRYLLARDSLLISYPTNLDMRSLPAGNYQVCGLSFLQTDSTKLPLANGTLRLDTLRQRLANALPPFCGSMTDTCLAVTILPPPDTSYSSAAICAGDSLFFRGRFYKTAGFYLDTLPTAAGCDSILRLDLQVIQSLRTNLQPTICNGQRFTLGPRQLSATGVYTEVFRAATGCDSIVTVNLTVLPPAVGSLDTVICQGQRLVIAGRQFLSTGTYTVPLMTARGCDSTLTVRLTVLQTESLIDVPEVLSCKQPTVVLNGSRSTPLGNVAYRWEDSMGGDIGDQATLPVTVPGLYFLQITTTQSGVTCGTRQFVNVRGDFSRPVVDAGVPATFDCRSTTIPLGGSATSAGAKYQYTWKSANGRLGARRDTVLATALGPGAYRLVVSDTISGCQDSAQVVIAADTLRPLAQAGGAKTISCFLPAVTLGSANTSQGSDYTILWSGRNGQVITAPAQAIITVQDTGWYDLLVSNIRNGCTQQDSVTVGVDTVAPKLQLAPASDLTCAASTTILDASGSQLSPATLWQWQALNGGRFLADSLTLQPQVDRAGIYQFSAQDTLNGCVDTILVTIQSAVNQPQARISGDTTLTCSRSRVQLTGQRDGQPHQVSSWTTVVGGFSQSLVGDTALVNQAGWYFFTVRDTITDCSTTDSIRVLQDTLSPGANILAPLDLHCGRPEITLTGGALVGDPAVAFAWTGPCLLTESSEATIQVNCAGNYQLAITNPRNGCTSTAAVEVRLDTAAPRAVLAATTVAIDCATGEAQLDGTASTGGVFAWQQAGSVLGTTSTLRVNNAGTYTLIVRDTLRNCADTAQVAVTLDCKPELQVILPDSLTCDRETVRLSVSTIPAVPGLVYQWTRANTACFLGPTNGPDVEVRCTGIYRVIVTNPQVGLSDTALVEVFENTQIPLAEAGDPDTIKCTQLTVMLDGTGSSSGSVFRYVWTNFSGDTLATTLQTPVTVSGSYFLEVTDTRNGCSAVDFVAVAQDTELPVIRFGTPVYPCGQDTFAFRALVTPFAPQYSYQWTGPGVIGQADSLEVLLDQPGTYRLAVTDPVNNCTISADITLLSQDCPPCIDIAPVDTLRCDLPVVTLAASLCEPCTDCSFLWSGPGIQGPANQMDVQVTVSGLYDLQVVNNQTGLTAGATVFVPADQRTPAIQLGEDSTLTCDRTAVTYVVPSLDSTRTYAFNWQNLSGPFMGDPQATTVTLTTSGIFVLTVQDTNNGCVGQDTVRVTLDNTPPVAEAGPPQVLNCSSPRVTLLAVPPANEQDLVYAWLAKAGGNILGGASAISPIVNRAGKYILQITNTRTGCISRDSVDVTADVSLPMVPVIPNQELTCRDTMLLLAGALPATGGDFSGRWCTINAVGDTLGCQPGLTRLVRAPGTYVFEVTNQNTFCKNSVEVLVTQNLTPPGLTYAARDTLRCTSPDLTLIPVGDTSGIQARWTAQGNSLFLGENTLNPQIFQPDTYWVELVDQLTGCQETDTIRISADVGRPVVNAGLDTVLTCRATRISLNGSGTGSNGSVLGYSWSTTNGRLVGSRTIPAPVVDLPGTYLLAVTDSGNGCVGSDVVTVGLDNAKPQAGLAEQGPYMVNCRNTNLVLDASISRPVHGQGLLFRWRSLVGTTIGGDSTLASITITQAGRYRVVVTDRQNGCRDSLEAQVGSDFRAPQLSLLPPGLLTCVVKQTTLRTQQAFPVALTYSWLRQDTVVGQDPTLTVDRPGRYVLISTRQDNGCVERDSVEVLQDLRTLALQLVMPDALDCDHPTVALDAQATGGNSIRYSWSTTTGGFVGEATGPTVLANAPGYYRVFAEDKDSGCNTTDSVFVELLASAIDTARITLTDPGCSPGFAGSIRIDSVAGGMSPYRYSLNGRSGGPLFAQLTAGTYTLVITDDLGCSWTTFLTLATPEPLMVDLGPDQEIRAGDSILLTPQASVDQGLQYQWLPAGGFVDPTLAEQYVRPLVTTVYQVRVSTANGCSATDAITIRVTKENPVYMPTAFSPNGDGVNDTYVVFSAAEVTELEGVWIFDRWGTLLFTRGKFTPNDPALGWDGTYRGTEMPAGVYVCRVQWISPDGRPVQEEREVVLIR